VCRRDGGERLGERQIHPRRGQVGAAPVTRAGGCRDDVDVGGGDVARQRRSPGRRQPVGRVLRAALDQTLRPLACPRGIAEDEEKVRQGRARAAAVDVAIRQIVG
jgi:hypothetical protein